MSLAFIGAINQGNPPQGGEEYKNQLLLSKIKISYEWKIMIDTHRWKNNPGAMWSLIKCLLFKNPDIILISASSVSTYRLLKLIHLFRPSLIFNTTYLVIGGYFPEGVRESRFDWRAYKDLKNIIVQGETLKRNLQAHSELKNITVTPNFKNFPIIHRVQKKEISVFKFVFVGRISKGKGIKEILEAINILGDPQTHFEVDFYGPIEENFDLETDKSKYCGFLDFQNEPEMAYSKLSEYDCMLFPTYWKGEGFPGVVIDAFVVGLPVIATDWNMNTEIIKDGVNGFIIEPKNSKALADKMQYVMQNRQELEKISKNNLARVNDYHIDIVWPQIMELL